MLIKGVQQIVGIILFRNAKNGLFNVPFSQAQLIVILATFTHPNFLIMEVLRIVSIVLSTSEADIAEHIAEIPQWFSHPFHALMPFYACPCWPSKNQIINSILTQNFSMKTVKSLNQSMNRENCSWAPVIIITKRICLNLNLIMRKPRVMQNFYCVFMKIWDGIDFPGLSQVFYPIRDGTICRIYISNEDARNI